MINTRDRSNPLANLNPLRILLADLIKEGVMVVSQDLQPIYLNLKAREICDQLWQDSDRSNHLPPIIASLHDQLINNSDWAEDVLVIDHAIAAEQIIRIRAVQLMLGLEIDQELSDIIGNSVASLAADRPWLLFFLEDRRASLQEELQIEQKKYDLTDRETEILKLLSQTYTYQEIAQALQISLNTVKFHAKNIYSKKRIYLDKQ